MTRGMPRSTPQMGKRRAVPVALWRRRSLSLPLPLLPVLPLPAQMDKRPAVSVAYFGEGAASEGDCHAAMNFAATLSVSAAGAWHEWLSAGIAKRHVRLAMNFAATLSVSAVGRAWRRHEWLSADRRASSSSVMSGMCGGLVRLLEACGSASWAPSLLRSSLCGCLPSGCPLQRCPSSSFAATTGGPSPPPPPTSTEVRAPARLLMLLLVHGMAWRARVGHDMSWRGMAVHGMASSDWEL